MTVLLFIAENLGYNLLRQKINEIKETPVKPPLFLGFAPGGG